MKTFTIDARGTLSPIVQGLVDKFNGVKADNNSVYSLDQEITFIVCQCGIAHGNLNKADKSAWLSPRNGDNSWNVSINW